MRRALLAMLLSISSAGFAHAAERQCPAKPQPVPPAIETADLPPGRGVTNIIPFAATPLLQHPGRPSVVRLFPCNRGTPAAQPLHRFRHTVDWQIEHRTVIWGGPLRTNEN